MTNYKNPVPSANVIIEKDNKILLVKRNRDPFIDKLCLPGGYMEWWETIENNAIREVKEETNIDIKLKTILGVYSHPDRHPGERHTLSVVFVAEILSGNEKAGDDAEEIIWVEPEKIDFNEIAFDHDLMIKNYIEWKTTKKTFWSTKNI